MPTTTYGKRTGVTTLKLLVKLMARLFLEFGPKINAWIDTMPDPADRVVVRTFLASLQAVALIIASTPDD